MHNADNERIKRRYFAYLKEAMRQNSASVDAAAKALAQFEAATKFRDFRLFHIEQAIAFKKRLSEQVSQATGDRLSKATLHATLAHLKRFFVWLAGQPGYKSRLSYQDAEYFNLSEKETRIANARRERPFPTVDQVRHVVTSMPVAIETELRDRALVAFTLLTGARDSAIASMKLKHVDLEAGCVYQDARDVRTKFSKTFTTYFFPVGEDFLRIVRDWVQYLRCEKHWSGEDPLFPGTDVKVGIDHRFAPTGLKRAHWSTAAPIRQVFGKAFRASGLPYFNPHSFRNTLVKMGQTLCRSPEEYKAWSQNLGHEGVLTTFRSYGAVSSDRQAQIISSLAEGGSSVPEEKAAEITKAVLRALRS